MADSLEDGMVLDTVKRAAIEIPNESADSGQNDPLPAAVAHLVTKAPSVFKAKQEKEPGEEARAPAVLLDNPQRKDDSLAEQCNVKRSPDAQSDKTESESHPLDTKGNSFIEEMKIALLPQGLTPEIQAELVALKAAKRSEDMENEHNEGVGGCSAEKGRNEVRIDDMDDGEDAMIDIDGQDGSSDPSLKAADELKASIITVVEMNDPMLDADMGQMSVEFETNGDLKPGDTDTMGQGNQLSAQAASAVAPGVDHTLPAVTISRKNPGAGGEEESEEEEDIDIEEVDEEEEAKVKQAMGVGEGLPLGGEEGEGEVEEYASQGASGFNGAHIEGSEYANSAGGVQVASGLVELGLEGMLKRKRGVRQKRKMSVGLEGTEEGEEEEDEEEGGEIDVLNPSDISKRTRQRTFSKKRTNLHLMKQQPQEEGDDGEEEGRQVLQAGDELEEDKEEAEEDVEEEEASEIKAGKRGKSRQGISPHSRSANASRRVDEPLVKFAIKSFTVPELVVALPESSTVGQLKKAVMDAAMKLLGGGLRVRVLLHGKRLQDEAQSLGQAGISRSSLDPSKPLHSPPAEPSPLSFMLEPTSMFSVHPGDNDPLLVLSQAAGSTSARPSVYSSVPPLNSPATNARAPAVARDHNRLRGSRNQNALHNGKGSEGSGREDDDDDDDYDISDDVYIEPRRFPRGKAPRSAAPPSAPPSSLSPSPHTTRVAAAQALAAIRAQAEASHSHRQGPEKTHTTRTKSNQVNARDEYRWYSSRLVSINGFLLCTVNMWDVVQYVFEG